MTELSLGMTGGDCFTTFAMTEWITSWFAMTGYRNDKASTKIH